mgnify:CR=1 FL=1
MIVEPGKCYSIAGRKPIVVTTVEYGASRRIKVIGYTPVRYSRLLKHRFYDTRTDKTVGELLNIAYPKPTEFRYNYGSKIVEHDITELVPDWGLMHQTYSTDQIDQMLASKRH